MSRKTMMWSVRGDLLVTVERALEGIPEDEWKLLIAAHQELWKTTGDFRMLVYSEGTGPSAKQRTHAVESGWGKRRSPVAVVTDSLIVRGILTAFSWFGVNIAGFAPKNQDAAFDHLRLTPEERRWAEAEQARMREALRRGEAQRGATG